MNICFVHEEYPEETNFGGIATYQKIMAEELVRQGNTVHVICRGLKENKEYEENGVKIHRIFVKNTKNQINNYIKYRKKVSYLLRQLQKNNLIDIIETPDWGAETIYFEKYRKVPLVVRLHTPLKVWLKYNKNSFGKVKNKLLRWEHTMLKKADLVTCCSNILKEIVVEEFDIQESKIIVTPNPINTQKFYRDKKIKKEDKLIFVGSLEERKGVCILAQALNLVFKKYPKLKIDFIGKDTTRNSQNISTKQLIYNIVNKKYKNNINFLGAMENSKLNYYLNNSKIGIFPSLFDNFPYVVLESMLTGLHIIGSKNSGMVEMLNGEEASLYNTGDYKDLAHKIIDKYELSLKKDYCKKNIDIVKNNYNAFEICLNMLNMYKKCLQPDSLSIELQNVLNNITKEKIISYKQEKYGVANKVFKIKTKTNKYIIKKYLYDYDFNLSNNLYDKYSKNNIQILRPINEKIIDYNNYKYNIFKYMKKSIIKKYNDINLFEKLIICERKINLKPTLHDKCNKYYSYLLNENNFTTLSKESVKYVLDTFSKLKEIKFLNEQYINHGDLSKSNILNTNKGYFIIDFDEATVTTPLYDFAVVTIKNFVKKDKLNIKKYNLLKEKLKNNYKKYTDEDYINIIKFYLCKILIEKFYLHQKNKINLFSKKQKKDYYKKYLKILKNISNR